MKKYLLSLMAVALVAMVGLCVTSCDDDGSDNDLLYGSWTSMVYHGNYDSSHKIVFEESGKGHASDYGTTRQFKYKMADNKLTLTFTSDNSKEVYRVELLTTLSLNLMEDGYSTSDHQIKYSRD